MKLMTWFSADRADTMCLPWVTLEKQGDLDEFRTTHRWGLFNNLREYIANYFSTRDWIWLFSGPAFDPSILPFAGASLFKTNTIFFTSGTHWQTPKYKSHLGISRQLWREYLERSTLVTATTAAQNALKQSFDLGSEVIPHAVDSTKFRPLNDADNDTNIVLFIGRFVEQKGIRELLRVATILPETKFWFCGTGPLAEQIRQAGMTKKNVRYFGYIDSRTKLVKIYNQASVLVLPTLKIERFGRVIIESLSCGTPVIATPRPGPRSILTDRCGILLRENTTPLVEQLSEQIQQLLDDDERRQSMGRAGSELVKSKYDVQIVSSQWMDIFRSVK